MEKRFKAMNGMTRHKYRQLLEQQSKSLPVTDFLPPGQQLVEQIGDALMSKEYDRVKGSKADLMMWPMLWEGDELTDIPLRMYRILKKTKMDKDGNEVDNKNYGRFYVCHRRPKLDRRGQQVMREGSEFPEIEMVGFQWFTDTDFVTRGALEVHAQPEMVDVLTKRHGLHLDDLWPRDIMQTFRVFVADDEPLELGAQPLPGPSP